MAIIGLTHGEDGRIVDKVIKYRGKISTGWGPKEGPNKDNFPKQAGKFVFMKEETISRKAGDKVLISNKWSENKAVQKMLEEASKSKDPRTLETICLVKNPGDLWESFLAKYNHEGLECRGGGIGTDAKYLTYNDDGEREWKTKPCTFESCPDYISGACKARGVMNVYPTVDAVPPNPYKFTTSSINTIRNIESSLDDIWNLLQTAHAVKESEAGRQLGFDGMFGLKIQLVLKKKKSGGRDVFVTEIVTSKKFRDSIMSIINREIGRKSEVAAIEGGANVSLLENAAAVMIEHEEIEVSPAKAALAAASEALAEDE